MSAPAEQPLGSTHAVGEHVGCSPDLVSPEVPGSTPGDGSWPAGDHRQVIGESHSPDCSPDSDASARRLSYSGAPAEQDAEQPEPRYYDGVSLDTLEAAARICDRHIKGGPSVVAHDLRRLDRSLRRSAPAPSTASATEALNWLDSALADVVDMDAYYTMRPHVLGAINEAVTALRAALSAGSASPAPEAQPIGWLLSWKGTRGHFTRERPENPAAFDSCLPVYAAPVAAAGERETK